MTKNHAVPPFRVDNNEASKILALIKKGRVYLRFEAHISRGACGCSMRVYSRKGGMSASYLPIEAQSELMRLVNPDITGVGSYASDSVTLYAVTIVSDCRTLNGYGIVALLDHVVVIIPNIIEDGHLFKGIYEPLRDRSRHVA